MAELPTTEPLLEEKKETSEKKGFLRFFKKDANGKESQTPTPTLNEEGDIPQYEEAVKKAKETEFNDEEAYLKEFIYQGGTDNGGRPLIIVVGSALPAKTNPERLLLYIIKVMDQPVENDYALIYIHTATSSENRPSFAFLRRAYRTMSRKYKKNLKALYIIHPSFWIKTIFKFFRPLISQKFWQKLNYIEDINDIYKFISRNSITLPKIVFEHNVGTNKKDVIFGTSLEEVLARQDHSTLDIPIVVHKCIKYFREKEANKLQGIFRLSPGAVMIQELKKSFDKGEDVSLSHIEDPHVIAGLLKLYLRELPDPVFPYEDFKKLVEAYKSKEKQIEEFRNIFSELPPPNKALVKAILDLLAFIVEKAEVNKMNSSNLSIVFAPNLIRLPPEESNQVAMYTPIINSVMRLMIDQYDELVSALQKSD